MSGPIKLGSKVRVVGGSREYATSPALVGKTGRIIDGDTRLVLVYLDDVAPGNRTQYWAYPSELEALETAKL